MTSFSNFKRFVSLIGLIVCLDVVDTQSQVPSSASKPSISWNRPRRGMAVGTTLTAESTVDGGPIPTIMLYLKKDSGPLLRYCFVPEPVGHIFHLKDSNGNEVPRTQLGQKIGKPIPDVKKVQQIQESSIPEIWLEANVPSSAKGWIDLGRFFEITKAGKYVFEGDIRVFQTNVDGEILNKFDLPIKVEIELPSAPNKPRVEKK